MSNILLIHGPNLNLLGEREPKFYGHTSLADINQRLEAIAEELGHTLHNYQSNAEADIINKIQAAIVEFIIINPAAYTHTSIAIRDALSSVNIPFIEVHLSNVHAREPFRRHSYFSDKAIGVICGFGPYTYELALLAAHHTLNGESLHHGHS